MRDEEMAQMMPLETSSLRVSSWFLGFKEGDGGSPFLPRFSFKKKKGETHTADVDGVIQNDGNDSFSRQQILNARAPPCAGEGKY